MFYYSTPTPRGVICAARRGLDFGSARFIKGHTMQSITARRSSFIDRDLFSSAQRLLSRAGKAKPRPPQPVSHGRFTAEPLEARQLLAADLSVSLLFPSATVLPTEEISGTLTLRNIGDTVADNFVTRIVLSQDAIFGNGDDISIEDIAESGNGGLVGGEIFTVTGTLTIPQVVPAGTYYLLAKIDVNNEVGENNENNNIYTSIAGLITVADRPQVSVAATDAIANEALGDTARFAITRSGPTGLPLTVTYNITGTAAFGLDYTPVSGTVTFQAGESVAYVTIIPDDDTDLEGNETVVLTITSGEDYDAASGAAGLATITIVDNEPVTPPAADLAAGIAGAIGEFLPGETINTTFARSNFGQSNANNFTTRFVLSINNIYGDADDIFVADVLNSSTLASGDVVANGQGFMVPFSAVPLQAYYLLGRIDVLNTVPEIDESNNLFGTSSALITIATPPAISIVATDASASETPGNPGVFTLTRTGPIGLALTVNLTITGTATNGIDYTTATAIATFAVGSATATVTILPIDDSSPENNETVIFTLTSGNGYTVSTTNNTATVTIIDNEPLISVVATQAATSETPGSAAGQFTFSREGSTDATITVNFAVTGTGLNGTDYTTIATSVTFGIGQTTVTIDISALDDALFEPTETVIISLQSGATYTVSSLAGTATVSIADDEPVFAVTSTTNSASETPGTPPGVFTFTRTGPTTSAFSLPYSITGTAQSGIDYTALSGMITFGIGESTVTLDLSTIDDMLVEDAQTVILTILATNNYGVDNAAFSATVTINDDEPTISVVSTVTSTSETPGSTAARFTFTRTGPLDNGFSATYTIAGTATANSDYNALSGTITFVAGSATAFIDLLAIDDAIAENTETIIITVSASDSYRIDNTAATATVNLIDDEPTISIVATDALAAEIGSNTGLFTLTRTGPLTGPFTLTILVTGTATPNGDYTAISTTVTFLAGESTATIDVLPIDDLDVEGDETVIISLVADPSFRIGSAAGIATVVINDNESAVSITALDPNASEIAGDTARIVFSRIGALQNDLTVTYSIAGTATNGVDFTQLTGTIIIPANQSSITLTIAALQDLLRESTETILITVTPSADYSIDIASATVVIGDDESNPSPASDLTAALTLSASQVRPDQIVNITLTVRNRGTTPGSDFDTQIVLSTNNIFGDADDILLDSVRILGSSMPNGTSRIVTFMITVPDLAPGTYFVLAKTDTAAEVTETSETNNLFRPTGSGNFTIAPPPTISVAATDAAAAEVSGTTVANNGLITFTRTGPTGGILTINYTLAGTATAGLDYTNLSGTVTFAIGSSTATVSIAVLADLIAEGSESIIVGVGRGPGYSINLTRQQATVNIADDEPVVTISAADRTGAETSGTANGGRYTVRRTGSTLLPLVVNYTVSGTATSGSDFTALTGTVTIPAGATSANINLAVLQDTTVEDPETVIVTLAPNTAYSVGTTSAATVTITDDEPTVSIIATDAIASEAGENLGRFTVTRTGSRLDALVVQYTLSGTAFNINDYDALSGFVTIPAGEASATIIITPADDELGEVPETVIVTLSVHPSYHVADLQDTATVTISDNEAVVTITAATNPATEAGLRTSRYTVTRTGPRTNALTVTYIMEGTAIAGTDFAALPGTIIIPAGASSVTITLTPLSDNFGEASETAIVTLQNGPGYRGGDTNSSATINITDDEPVATVTAPDITATESGPTSGSFRITLSRAVTVDTIVTYTLGGTALSSGPEADFAPLTGAVFIAAGQRTANVFITALQDVRGEGSETVTLTLVGNTGYLVGAVVAPAPIVTITDDEPFVRVVASDPSAGEGGQNPGRYTFSRTGSTTNPLTITYTLAGTATTDDYAPLTGTLTFLAGSSTAAIVLSPTTDALAEETETVILTINGNSGYQINSLQGEATVNIAALGPIVSIVGADIAATEGSTNTSRFTVSRTGSTTDPLTVFLSLEGTATPGTDYSGLGTMVTIPAGRSSVVVTLTATEDVIGEGNETAIVTIEGNDAYRIDTTKTTATATITDNEPVVKIIATDAIATEGSTSDTARFTVSRIGSTTNPITVNYTISGTATSALDFAALSGTIIIPAGRSSTVLTLSALADLIIEGDESLILELDTGAGYRLSSVTTELTATATLRNAGVPDLGFDALTVSPASISLTTPGQLTPVTANFKNLGAAAASSFRVELRLSANDILGDADDIILGFIDVATLAALANGTATFNINWDATASPALGSYYLGARIDSRNRVSESSEGNNDFVTATPVITIIP